jgi:putative ABC transport system ATP-binding protein
MNLQLTNVSKSYGEGDARFWALRDVDLDVDRSDFLSIVGPSGSGKSTLMHLLGCLDRPSSGEVRVDGRETIGLSDRELSLIRRNRIGFVFQQFFLNDSMTAYQNVLLPMEIAGVAGRRDRASEALDRVGLRAKAQQYPSQLSGGEQQRCAIARALANHPEIVLADEPTGSLDSKTGQEILGVFRELHDDRNLGVVLVTHDREIAEQGKRKVEVFDGRVS